MTRLQLFSIASLLLLSATVHAAYAPWTKIIDCEENRMVIQRSTSDPDSPTAERYQVVFRDPNLVGELLQSGAVATHRLTSLSEIALNLVPLKGEQPSWVGEDDTRRLIGVVYYFRVRGDSLSFEARRTTGERDGSYASKEVIGNWTFGRCVEPSVSPLLANIDR